MRNFVEEESIADANSIPSDTLSHTSNKQRNNASAIFTSQKLDKLDELVGAEKKVTINDPKYYE